MIKIFLDFLYTVIVCYKDEFLFYFYLSRGTWLWVLMMFMWVLKEQCYSDQMSALYSATSLVKSNGPFSLPRNNMKSCMTVFLLNLTVYTIYCRMSILCSVFSVFSISHDLYHLFLSFLLAFILYSYDISLGSNLSSLTDLQVM